MSESYQQAHARMERDRLEHNQQVRARQYCVECGSVVPDDEYGGEYWSKYMAAGGLLHGPFCSKACYWGSLGGDES